MVRFTLAVLMTLGLAAPCTAAGQQRDTTHHDTLGVTTPIVLEPIEVRGSIIPAAGPTVGSGVPARVSIVTAQEIEAWEPRLVVDALASQAGVSLYDDLGSSYKLNLSTRGFSAGPTVGVPQGVAVFLDGIRQNEPDAQEVNFDLLPMEHVQRVELLSGNASLLGPNSLGGAVNLVTLRGGGPLTGGLEVSGGSFGVASAEGSLSGRMAGRWAYYLGGGYEREDGWRDATDAKNYNVFVNLGRLGEARGIQFQGYAAKSRASEAGSLPESIFDTLPSANFTPGDFDDLNGEQLSLSGYAPVGPGRGSFAAYYRRSRAERFNVNQEPDPNVRGRTTNNTGGGNVDWRVVAGTGKLALRAGLDWEANLVQVHLYNEPQDGSPAELTTNVESPGWSVAGYTLADLRVGRATFSLGGRYDFVTVPFRNLLEPLDDTTSTFQRFNPRGGVTFDVGGGASVYASAGQSFRAPAILELACADPQATCPLPFALGEDPPLKPVRSTTYEIGGRWGHGAVTLNGSAYLSHVRDEILFVASEGSLNAGYFTNVSETQRLGVEIAAHLTIGRLAGYVNYAYTNATFQSPAELFSVRSDSDFAGSPYAGPNDVVPGDRMPLVPEHQVKLGALARIGNDMDVGVSGRFIGEQWLRGDEANETGTLDAYFIADARVGYDAGLWEVDLILTNLLNARSAVFGTFNENRETGELERFLTPAAARTVKLTVRRKFGPGAVTASR